MLRVLRRNKVRQNDFAFVAHEYSGKFITHDFEEIAELVKVSPRPIVVGGGVKLKDIPALAATKVQGFFVVSAVAGAADPQLAARELVRAWHDNL